MPNFTSRTKTFNIDIDARIWAINVLNNGGTLSLDTLYKVSNFTKTLKRDGLWNKILDMGIFAGGNLNAALTKLKTIPGISPYLINNNFVEEDYIESGSNGGLSGDASTKYLDTNIKANSTQFFNTHLSVYNKRNWATADSSTNLIGFYTNTSSGSQLLTLRTADAARTYIYGNLGTSQAFGQPRNSSSNELLGHIVGSNSSACYKNGVIFGASGGGTANTISDNLYDSYVIFGIRVNGTVSEIGNGVISFYSIGLGLSSTDAINYYNSVQQLQIELNRHI